MRSLEQIHTPDFQVEFERLKSMFLTVEGRKEINDAVEEATQTNIVATEAKADKSEFKKAGFGIDMETGECLFLPVSKTGTHNNAYAQLLDRQIRARNLDPFTAEQIIRPGKAFYTKLFEFPLIIVYASKDEVKNIERIILEKKIGLPITGLYIENNSNS